MDSELLDYYRRRANEYEAIYAKHERQGDLAKLRELIPAALAGRRVLEVACGTGYWTALIAQVADAVVATDMAEETLQLAASKSLPAGARFEIADAYALAASLGEFDAAFAGFWWSHVPRSRIGEFLGSLRARLATGAKVMLLDNRYVEGSSTPLAGFDAEGNTFQMRKLADGSSVRVMKNFPSEEELRESLASHASGIAYRAFDYYWLADFTLR